ncbi:MAG TPA: methylenetetrahydrofolate reductase [NAD(P)H] [Thiotrichales bacterium]|nr:methylenetetrahydrofolate reductase [NAD(P)H] [Thiotrichales bacterium]
MESQKNFSRSFSFEFFPPKTAEGREKLETVLAELGALHPDYFSVTFGAGGSTQQGTYETVLAIRDAGFEAAPHLSCIGSTREGIRAILHQYLDAGIRRIVALRGDMPSGMHEAGEFRHANELVAFIREKTGDRFHIEVAAYPEFHPQAPNAIADIDFFMNKVRAGANGAITQYFYNVDAYLRFIEACEARGLDVPVVPGIMPITNYVRLARFSDACGAEIPRWLRKRLEAFGDDTDSITAFGIDVVTALCERLLAEGAPGLHFYTMNRTEPTRTIWRNLGLPK